jgi:hypothetical protein
LPNGIATNRIVLPGPPLIPGQGAFRPRPLGLRQEARLVASLRLLGQTGATTLQHLARMFTELSCGWAQIRSRLTAGHDASIPKNSSDNVTSWPVRRSKLCRGCPPSPASCAARSFRGFTVLPFPHLNSRTAALVGSWRRAPVQSAVSVHCTSGQRRRSSSK